MNQLRLNLNISDRYKNMNPNDVVFTPKIIAQGIINIFKPTGKCLDPCKGEGVFFDLLPANSDWCEIAYNKDFFDYHQKVDWIVSNPPYSNWNDWLKHSFELAENVVYLTPMLKICPLCPLCPLCQSVHLCRFHVHTFISIYQGVKIL